MRTRVVLVVLGVALAASTMLLLNWPQSDVPDRATGRTGLAPPLGESPSARDQATPGGPTPPPTTVEKLDRDRNVYGLVVGANGSPIAGAQIQSSAYPEYGVMLPVRSAQRACTPGASTCSAGDGTFMLPLSPGSTVDLRVSASGHVPITQAFVRAGEYVTIVLSEGCALQVSVNDTHGEPLSGALVFVGRSRLCGSSIFEAQVVADASGLCVIDKLPGPCTATVWVRHRDVALSPHIDVDLPRAGTKELQVTVNRGRLVRGRIVDGHSGAPIRGAKVGVGWILRSVSTTDKDGLFELAGWEDRWHPLYVVADGYGVESVRLDGRDEITVELLPDQCVVGRILDGGHQPVEGVFVSAVGRQPGQRGGSTLSSASARTDSGGRFRLRGLNRACSHTLIVRARGLGRCLWDFDAAVGGADVVDLGDLCLPPGQIVAGCVVSPDGAPAPRVRVYLTGANTDRGRFRDGITLDHRLGTQNLCFTDDLGRFCFMDVSAGEYVLRVMAEGERPVERAVSVEAGGDVRDLTVRLATLKTVEVHVTTEQGLPIESARVFVVGDAGTSSAVTDDDGIAAVRVCGAVQLIAVTSAGKSGCFPSRSIADVERWMERVDVVLPPGEPLAGVVRMPSGDPLPLARVRLSGDQWATVVDADVGGRFIATVPVGVAVDIRYVGHSDSEGPCSMWQGEIQGTHERDELCLQLSVRGVTSSAK